LAIFRILTKLNYLFTLCIYGGQGGQGQPLRMAGTAN